jgi:hypothetical protein
MLTAGIFMTPLWLAMLAAIAFNEKYRQSVSALEVGVLLMSILAVIGGVLGLTGLFRVLRGLLSATEELPSIGQTRAFVLIGVGTLIYMAAMGLWHTVSVLLVVAVPPLLASGHIVYLAGRKLFVHDQ